ncbi:Type II secretory pathway, component HofQ [Cupriavidus necator]|uniref:Type IV pilus biogenesis and competence protein PilQ n=1 Tax=Cupriavidus necator (strain ATCC 17699 / DSM 428 / KCTC 22496 / NCIMB 10442 / H16 / Stanier 337) TaxID=381666 RepID=Q0K667_CUPNH|nr:MULTISPECIES: type IV pilus secretin PilQ [Cupriavidus]EON18518.1 pili assembly protein PilQ [Cupriavidus sp. GA3-3]KUE86720.1 secretin [Cupriavidus necator]QCC02254.1 type IV pilus secretin PilQ [Cupriavidus necator H16]QQB78339.1 type IV pilus secretin PilQ [Cupriavidus necator]WKA40659.1 type IV pilus secretin PilQ [Cupriavidus necator]
MTLARWYRALAGAARMAMALLLVIAAPAALAQSNRIKSVDVSMVGEQTVFTIELERPLAQKPADFTTQNPARLAIDFFDTGFANRRAQYDYGGKLVKSANVVQIGDRTRVILDLTRNATYRTDQRGNYFVVALDNVAPALKNAAPTFAPAATPAAAAARPSVRNVDFRRGADGAGRVVVDLSSRDSGINIAQQGKNIVVDFLGTTLPDNLRRRFDVSDFGTPVQGMHASDTNGNARLTIEPRGNWEYSSYQTDTQFVVEVRPVKEDPTKLISGPGYRGERLSLNFQNIDIRSLLQVFADFTNLNIITSESVQGNLTLRLKDVPWDQALQIVMDAKGLASRRNGNVLWVAPKAELQTKEKLELESQQQINDLEPIRSQVFQLNYQRAEDVRKMLLGMGAGGGAVAAVSTAGSAGASARMLSRRGSLTADARTNQLFVSDIASKLEEVQNFIGKIDIPVRQVIIEARIVEATDSFSRNLGVKLGFAGQYNNARVGNTYNNVLPGATSDNGPFLSLPAGAINGTNPANIAVSLFNSAATKFLALELSALEADGKGKIISSPRVVTANNIKALIEQGTELPYQAATSSGATSVQFRKANLKLEVTPQITPEGNVLLDVDVNKDSVGIQTTSGFAIDTKHVQTQVLVENGGTVVIGGIYTQTESNETDKVPLLGDIPVLGYLFKNNAKVRNRTELLVFLTPRILNESVSLR